MGMQPHAGVAAGQRRRFRINAGDTENGEQGARVTRVME